LAWVLVSCLPLVFISYLVVAGPWVSLKLLYTPLFSFVFFFFYGIKETSDLVAAGAGSATTVGTAFLYRNRHRFASRIPVAVRPPLQYPSNNK
jgi:hypothetical protein